MARNRGFSQDMVNFLSYGIKTNFDFKKYSTGYITYEKVNLGVGLKF